MIFLVLIINQYIFSMKRLGNFRPNPFYFIVIIYVMSAYFFEIIKDKFNSGFEKFENSYILVNMSV